MPWPNVKKDIKVLELQRQRLEAGPSRFQGMQLLIGQTIKIQGMTRDPGLNGKKVLVTEIKNGCVGVSRLDHATRRTHYLTFETVEKALLYASLEA